MKFTLSVSRCIRHSEPRRLNALRHPLFPTLGLTLALGLTPGLASAQQNMGLVTINDTTEGRITGNQSGGTNQINQNLIADEATPEVLTFSLPIDGTVAGGTGYAVMKDAEGISDILQVTVTPRVRGGNIPYFDASGTFTSDGENSPLDLNSFGLSQEVINAILAAAVEENGQQQNLSSHLIDSATGRALDVGGLTVTAASDFETPEPSGLLAFGLGSAVLGAHLRARRRSTTK
jgi:hypothetical protein